ncbi:hypothetical protein SLEP1_g12074 [Rubroshorea leprosula]|nr:hypothetical protein SLEP1_g12074 [Rubroshorea leprosula]
MYTKLMIPNSSFFSDEYELLSTGGVNSITIGSGTSI